MRITLWFIFFSCFFSSLSSAQVVTRGPYMTQATPDGITIQWRTDLPCNSQVKFGFTAVNLNNTYNQLNAVTEHRVSINNLQPGTKYFYSVGSTVQVFQGDTQNYFVTNPLPSPLYDKKIRFWAMGDMGKQTQQQINVREAFKKYVDTSVVNGWILLGDNAYPVGADLDYQNGFFTPYLY